MTAPLLPLERFATLTIERSAMPNEERKLPIISLNPGVAVPHHLGGAPVNTLASANAEVKRKMAASLSDRAAGKLSGLGHAQLSLAPAIVRVNDKTKLDFEPGGQYEISGHGFGEQRGSAFLRFDHYNVTFRIDAWHDGKLYVGLADDISGMPDAAKPTLFVDVPGSASNHTLRLPSSKVDGQRRSAGKQLQLRQRQKLRRARPHRVGVHRSGSCGKRW